MNLLKDTIVDYIKFHIDFNSRKADSALQMKISSKVLNFDEMSMLLTDLNQFYYSNSNVNLNIKVSKQLIDFWEECNFNIQNLNENWKDKKGNLTFYRNELATKTDKRQNVLLLIGCDLVDDTASLEHLITCDYSELYSNYMKNSFYDWIELFIKELGYSSSLILKKEKEKANTVLKELLKYFDLDYISNYLNKITETKSISEQISLDQLLLKHLYLLSSVSCSIKVDKKFPETLNKIINISYELFSKRIKLEGVKQNKYQTNINKFINTSDEKVLEIIKKIEENKDSNYPTFDNFSSFIEACSNLVNCDIKEDEANRLRKCNFEVILNKIFGIRTASIKQNSNLVKLVEGNPFEMVLGALWDSFFSAKEKEEIDLSKIKKIEINPVSFFHNIPTKEIKEKVKKDKNYRFVYDEKLRDCFGGLDDYLKEKVFSLLNIVKSVNYEDFYIRYTRV